jgi:hypothetical protein
MNHQAKQADVKQVGVTVKAKLLPRPEINANAVQKAPASACDFVEDLNRGIHATQLLDVASNDVSRDDTTYQLDHSICDALNAVNWDDSISVVCTVNIQSHRPCVSLISLLA